MGVISIKARESRPTDVDRHIGAKIRERRILLGMTQPEVAERIGVNYQQVMKYERGVNRVAAGHLFHLAKALGCGVDLFFEGLANGERAEPIGTNRMLQDLIANVIHMAPEHQEAVCALARALAEPAAIEAA